MIAVFEVAEKTPFYTIFENYDINGSTNTNLCKSSIGTFYQKWINLDLSMDNKLHPL